MKSELFFIVLLIALGCSFVLVACGDDDDDNDDQDDDDQDSNDDVGDDDTDDDNEGDDDTGLGSGAPPPLPDEQHGNTAFCYTCHSGIHDGAYTPPDQCLTCHKYE